MADNAGARMRALVRVLKGERAVEAAARRALQHLLDYGGRALASNGYDAATLSAAAAGWRNSTQLSALLGEVESVFLTSWSATERKVIDPSPYAVRHLEAVESRLVGLPDSVFDNMRTELVAGQVAQEGISQLAARIDSMISDEQRWTGRARTIARTEVIGANNAGAMGSARATAELLGEDPGSVVKEWLSTSDSRTRESHAEANGQQVKGLDTPFIVGGSSLDQPADPYGDPGEVINCRCTVLFLYPGDAGYPDDLQASSSSPGDAPGMTAVQYPGEVPVDPGPQTATEQSARGMTPEALMAESNTRGGLPVSVARAELARRGLTASGVVTPYAEGDAPPDAQAPADAPLEQPTHAGIAVQAADTARVLLLQRAIDPTDDPEVIGTWEFPGGSIDPEDASPEAAAWREFSEETGLPQPVGETTGGWRSPDGVYQGFVFTVPTEADAWPTLNPEAGVTVNPDDPQRATPEVMAWFTIPQIEGLGPALRPAVRDNTDWSQFLPPLDPAAAAEEPPVTDAPADPTPEQVAAALSLLSTWATTRGITMADAPADGAPPAPEGDGSEATAPAAVPDASGPQAADMPTDGQPFHGILWPEDTMSGDGRMVAAGSTVWRDLPLPFMAQDAQAVGHDGAVRTGRIDTITRDETTYAVPVVRYSGVWDSSPIATETARQVDNGVARGVSVDGDDVTVELRGSDGQPLDPMLDDFPEDGVVVEVATSARVAGATLCSIPAFQQAYVANGVYEQGMREPGWNADGTPLSSGQVPQGSVPLDEPVAVAAAAAAGEVMAPAWSLVAAGAPVLNSADFQNPGLTEPTRLTVTDDGRVYGHLATWGVCHIGIDGVCQEPPVSASNYAYFATGSVPTEAGYVAVGQLTMDTGHASMRASARAAVSHYDNTGTAVADVSMGQDDVGIWFSGRLRPEVTPAQVHAIRAAGSVSGDWRDVGGHLEAVAALICNVPGFPIPVPAVAASGARPVAMVASGVVRAPAPAAAAPDPSVPELARAVYAQVARMGRADVAAARLRMTRASQARRKLEATATAARRTRAAAAAARLTR